MGYAVELYFDERTENTILDLRHILMEHGISCTLGELGDRPHISLAVFATVDVEKLLTLTRNLAGVVKPVDFRLGAVGIFPTDENCLFLSPVPSRQLLEYHQDFHKRLAEANIKASPYYLPENWIPHCSIELNIPEEQFLKAVDICKKGFQPLNGRIGEIGVVEFRPIRTLAAWFLGK